jgi:hypothetical protein
MTFQRGEGLDIFIEGKDCEVRMQCPYPTAQVCGDV